MILVIAVCGVVGVVLLIVAAVLLIRYCTRYTQTISLVQTYPFMTQINKIFIKVHKICQAQRQWSLYVDMFYRNEKTIRSSSIESSIEVDQGNRIYGMVQPNGLAYGLTILFVPYGPF